MLESEQTEVCESSVFEGISSRLNVGEAVSADWEVEQSLPSCFEQLSRTQPDRLALFGEEPITFGELNRAANSFARKLLAHFLMPGDRVAVLMRPDNALIVAALAILKAHGIVTVLNPSDPSARWQSIVRDAEPKIIITDSANRNLAETTADEPPDIIEFEFLTDASGDLDLPILPAEVAFLVYTSGSTGRPKGVMKTHRGVLHNARRCARAKRLKSHDRSVLLAALSGGQGLATTWCALLSGTTLCPFPIMERGMIGLAEFLKARHITIWVSSSSVFRSFIKTIPTDEVFPEVRLVRLGSEAATPEDFASFQRHFSDDCTLFHTLSSSEAGNITHVHLKRDAQIQNDRLPSGKLSDGMEIILLDEAEKPVVTGGVGEIIVKSRFLSPGYWRNEALTAQRFSSADAEGFRTFRTGDLGRYLSDGSFMHCGRKDAQVKIHGYRVELSEIEETLAQCAEIERVLVCGRKTANHEVQLVAYVIVRPGRTCDSNILRQIAQGALPRYMMPSGFVFLDEFPLTAHGKIDREALSRIEPESTADVSHEEFATPTEAALADIWRRVFDRQIIGRQDNFFDLGGDSLSAAVLASLINTKLGVEVDFRMFSEHPNLSELAAAIDKRQRSIVADLPPIRRASRAGPLEVSCAEEFWWWVRRKQNEGRDKGTITTCYRLTGPLNIEVFRESLNQLAQRHEILRTTFEEIDGKPMRIIHEFAPVSFVQLAATSDGNEQLFELVQKERQRSFNLQVGPLIRFFLVRLPDDEFRFLKVHHHIISDRGSWKLFFRELAALYETGISGQPSTLPDFELQYADYASWQKQTFDPAHPSFRKNVEWWRNQMVAGRKPPKWFNRLRWSRKPPWLEVRMADIRLKRLWRAVYAKPEDGSIHWGIDPEISARLNQIGAEQRSTFFMTRLAVFAALCVQEARRTDICIGTLVSNRNRIEMQNMFGCFANVGVMRFQCDKSWTFREWLSQVGQIVSDTQTHSGIPFGDLRSALKKTRVRLSKQPGLVFVVPDHTASIRFGGLELSRVEQPEEQRMRTGFQISVSQHAEAQRCCASFDPRIYHPGKVHRFIRRLKELSEAVSQNPDAPLSVLLAGLKK